MSNSKVISILVFLSTMLFSQQYVVDLEDTGVTQLTVFQGADSPAGSITGLEVGDEIGIFDENGVLENCVPDAGCNPSTDTQYGEVLVGSGVWDGNQINIVSIVSNDLSAFSGPITNGAVEGNSLTIKVFRSSVPTEYGTEATWSAGSGVFGDIIQSISEIVLTDPNACEDDASNVTISEEESKLLVLFTNCNIERQKAQIKNICPNSANILLSVFYSLF